MSRAGAGRPIKAGSLCALLLAGALFWTGSALSQSRSVPQPIIEKARGEMCVAETEVMRRNHGDFLKHQRDDTVVGGVRGAKFSLKACVECHASPTSGSVAAKSSDFCLSCHLFTAVKIDCFACHASKPEQTSFHPLLTHGASGGQSLTLRLRETLAKTQAKP